MELQGRKHISLSRIPNVISVIYAVVHLLMKLAKMCIIIKIKLTTNHKHSCFPCQTNGKTFTKRLMKKTGIKKQYQKVLNRMNSTINNTFRWVTKMKMISIV